MFRFVHKADLHLDASLRSLALKDEDLTALAVRYSCAKPWLSQSSRWKLLAWQDFSLDAASFNGTSRQALTNIKPVRDCFLH